jgi:hypothetical protein
MGWQSGIAAYVAGLLAIGPSWAVAGENTNPDSVGAWTGFSVSMDAQYGYAGALYAFSNNLDTDGILARIGFGGGRYETEGDDSHSVDHYDLDVMLGYRANFERAVVSLYAGGDFKYHNNDDPDADIRGPELGVKAQIEAYVPLVDTLFAAGFANYSTAFDSFNASAKLEYRVSDAFSIGPEAGALGCEGFDQVRAGLASAFRIGEATELAPSAGAAWKFDESDYGLYGGLNLYTRF